VQRVLHAGRRAAAARCSYGGAWFLPAEQWSTAAKQAHGSTW
jgi:hypothetical protein